MTREFLLESAEDNSTLRLSCPDRSWGSITVEAKGNGFHVASPVYVDLAPSFPDFFDEIAAQPGVKRDCVPWETLEGELRFDASCDAVGHIYLVYHLRSSDIGSNRWWSFTGRMVLELGAMPDICKRARRFWNVAT